jgi:DNA-binding MarR family transcriptional regulator
VRAEFSWATLAIGKGGPPSSEARLVAVARRITKFRAYRAQHFDSSLFSDPVWDMMLELFSEHLGPRRSTLTSLSAASGLPISTALRYVRNMEQKGLVERVRDSHDARISHIQLTPPALEKMKLVLSRVVESHDQVRATAL